MFGQVSGNPLDPVLYKHLMGSEVTLVKSGDSLDRDVVLRQITKHSDVPPNAFDRSSRFLYQRNESREVCEGTFQARSSPLPLQQDNNEIFGGFLDDPVDDR